MAIQAEVNPYQAPGSEATKPSDAVEDPRAARRIKLAWVGVFSLNLCVPVFFGWLATEKGGRIGMFAGIAALFLVGYWLCTTARIIGQALVVGGVAVGLTQVFPVIQMMAGIVGLCLASLLRLHEPHPDDVMLSFTSGTSGFVVTIVTGGLLMAVALVAGLAIRRLFSARTSR